MITERDYKIEELAAEFKKKLSNEKRRYEQAQELAKKYKDDGEKKCAMLIEEVKIIESFGSLILIFQNRVLRKM